MPRKVAIIGGAPSSQMLAPFDDPSWEIWVLGNQLTDYEGKSIARVFEIHDNLSEQPEAYPEWLVSNAPRLVVAESFPIKEHAKQRNPIEIYPKDEVNKILGGHLSSSPAYMLGYAAWKNCFDEIGIYGIDMSVNDHEYFKQRPDMYAWIGYFMGKGVKVHIPEETPLFASTYDEGRDWGNKSTVGVGPFTIKGFQELMEYHKDRVIKFQKDLNDIKEAIAMNQGCIRAYEHMSNIARAVGSGAEIKNLKDVTWMKK